jgi:DnaJ family protein B protein 4
MVNHYETLGIPNDANESEIKKAYRKLSLMYHPDRNQSEEAKEKIQQINHAYEILSDSQSKQRYDHELKYDANNIPNGFPMNGEDMSDINNFFNMMFNGNGGFPGFGNMHPMHGGGPNIHEIHTMHGMPGMPNIRIIHSGNVFNMAKPEPIIKKIQITLEQSYHGCNLPVEIERSIFVNNVKSIEKETIYINIQQGVDDNEQILVHEKGNIINNNIGEVKIIIQVVNDTGFQRNGLDLIYNKKVSLKESLCGFTFDMVHLNGKKLCLNNISNPTVIKPNFKKVVASMGMIRDNSIGNMIIHFDVEFPDILTPEQISVISSIL